MQQIAEQQPRDAHHAARVGGLGAEPERAEAEAELEQAERELQRRARLGAARREPRPQRREHEAEQQDEDRVGGLERRGRDRRAAPPNARSTLRSVKLLIELPACSKNAQNSIEKNISTSATNSRSRSTRSQRSASNEQERERAAAEQREHDARDRAALHAQRDQRQRERDARQPPASTRAPPAAAAGARPALGGQPAAPERDRRDHGRRGERHGDERVHGELIDVVLEEEQRPARRERAGRGSATWVTRTGATNTATPVSMPSVARPKP